MHSIGGRSGCGLHECVGARGARPPQPLLPARALPRPAQTERRRRALRPLSATLSHPIARCALLVYASYSFLQNSIMFAF